MVPKPHLPKGKTNHSYNEVTLSGHLGESIEQSLVVVISDPTTILNLSEHVTHCTPAHTLNKVGSHYYTV